MSKTKTKRKFSLLMFISGLLMLSAGLFVLFHDRWIALNLRDILWWYGLMILVVGGLKVVSYFGCDVCKSFLLKGLLGVVIGFLMVFYAPISIQTSLILIVVWLLSLGTQKLLTGLQLLMEKRGYFLILLGLLGIGAGVAILLDTSLLLLMIGLYAAIYGLLIGIAAFRKKVA